MPLAKDLLLPNRRLDGRDTLAQATAFASDDFLEGNMAFLEKRAPRFTGQWLGAVPARKTGRVVSMA